MFVRRAAAAIGAAATSLPRIDALVFTGGIGEHSHLIRAGIVGRLGCVGIRDDVRDADADAVLTHGQISVLVVQAREDRVIADAVAEWLRAD